MKRTVRRQPPPGAPEGTVWFGGPEDRFKVTLRIMGDEVDPDHITSLMGRAPERRRPNAKLGIRVTSGDVEDAG